MAVESVVITLFAPSAHTLKDKRQILRSILDKTRHKFNVAIAEVADMDLCQRLVIGVACVSGSECHAREMVDEVVRFIEINAEADIVAVERT